MIIADTISAIFGGFLVLLVLVPIVIIVVVSMRYRAQDEKFARDQEEWVRKIDAQKIEEERRRIYSYLEFALENRPLTELVYAQPDGSEEQKETLEKIIKEYIRFNTGKNITPKIIADALHDIQRGARQMRLKGLESLTVKMQQDLLVK